MEVQGEQSSLQPLDAVDTRLKSGKSKQKKGHQGEKKMKTMNSKLNAEEHTGRGTQHMQKKRPVLAKLCDRLKRQSSVDKS